MYHQRPGTRKCQDPKGKKKKGTSDGRDGRDKKKKGPPETSLLIFRIGDAGTPLIVSVVRGEDWKGPVQAMSKKKNERKESHILLASRCEERRVHWPRPQSKKSPAPFPRKRTKRAKKEGEDCVRVPTLLEKKGLQFFWLQFKGGKGVHMPRSRLSRTRRGPELKGRREMRQPPVPTSVWRKGASLPQHPPIHQKKKRSIPPSRPLRRQRKEEALVRKGGECKAIRVGGAEKEKKSRACVGAGREKKFYRGHWRKRIENLNKKEEEKCRPLPRSKRKKRPSSTRYRKAFSQPTVPPSDGKQNDWKNPHTP